MLRCLALAKMGAGAVAPNPMVGAVLVYKNTIIGEGYHKKYGQSHAEVNCINSVLPQNEMYIGESTLYVSLEPCAHFGNTPPCTQLIILKKIPQVIIGCADSFYKVNGLGIQQLLAQGIKVEIGVLQKKCRYINKHFFTFNEKKRPYIYLKYAQTNDGYMANQQLKPLQISNGITNVYMHKYRAKCDGILVGKNTILSDNPSLTTRCWIGRNPVRIIIDEALQLDNTFTVFNDHNETVIINNKKSGTENGLTYVMVNENENVIECMLKYCFQNSITSLIVEGGAITLQHFIDNNIWDEAIVITNKILNIKQGKLAPVLKNEILCNQKNVLTDAIHFYKNNQNEFL